MRSLLVQLQEKIEGFFDETNNQPIERYELVKKMESGRFIKEFIDESLNTFLKVGYLIDHNGKIKRSDEKFHF